MVFLQSLLFCAVSLIATTIGAICGNGGGVIIKPTLDLFGWASVATISFLSSCTVLAMSCYSVGKSLIAGDKAIDIKTGTPLAIGAAVGGVIGKQLFNLVKNACPDPNMVGGVQALLLALLTVGTLVYTLCKDRIATKHVSSALGCLTIGFLLGLMSSFLGIGGGTINLVVLFYFFSMKTKTAAANSLYIILFCQITSLITTLVTGTVPPFSAVWLIMMVAGGLLGGVAGRAINKKISSKAVEKLFILLMIVIILINVWNVIRYLVIGG